MSELGLEGGRLGYVLAWFNLGIEIGQLAIVALLLPALHWLGASPVYRRALIPRGSLALIAVAAGWVVDRTLG